MQEGAVPNEFLVLTFLMTCLLIGILFVFAIVAFIVVTCCISCTCCGLVCAKKEMQPEIITLANGKRLRGRVVFEEVQE